MEAVELSKFHGLHVIGASPDGLGDRVRAPISVGVNPVVGPNADFGELMFIHLTLINGCQVVLNAHHCTFIESSADETTVVCDGKHYTVSQGMGVILHALRVKAGVLMISNMGGQ